ncbi:MAG: tRNA 2-thiouridine(34) synthase MnmA, partial [Oscillospiraceae bacterium]|nr:tRNA 2-thiouridine(34) synthase MnmA [Candidatus Equicaccousia limihippi]
YKAPKSSAVLKNNHDGSFTLIFNEPQRAVTPGQTAAIYDGEICLGGGEIVLGI